MPPLADIKPRVIEAIKRERAEALAMERAKALVAAVGKGEDFSAAAKAAGFAMGSVPLFSRAEPPKERQVAPTTVLLAALQTPAGQLSEPVKAGNGVYVVKTVERQPADAQGFEQQRAQLEQQALQQKRSQALDNWFRSQRASTEGRGGAASSSPTCADGGRRRLSAARASDGG